jgi:hypothetical protein
VRARIGLFSIVLALSAWIGCGSDGGGEGGASSDAAPDGGAAAEDGAVDDGHDPRDGGDGDRDSGGGARRDAGAMMRSDAGEPHGGSAYRLYYWGDFDEEDHDQLAAVDVPGAGAQPIAVEGTKIDAVAVARDGSLIAVGSAADGDSPSELRAYEKDTWSSSTLLATTESADVSFEEIAVSDDGAFVAYTTYDGSTDDEHVYVVASDGSAAPKQLDATRGTHPAWSRGGHLAYEADGTEYVVDPRGGSAKRVTTPELADPGEFAWSPNERLYFVARKDASSPRSLYSVKADASDVQPVPDAELVGQANPEVRFDELVASPDGKWLGCTAESDVGYEDAFAFNVAGEQDSQQLTQAMAMPPAAGVRRIAWRPDSQALVIALAWDVPEGQVGVSGSVLIMPLDPREGLVQIDAPPTAYPIEAVDFTFSPDRFRLYFRADGRSEGSMELFAIDDPSVEPADPFGTRVQGVTGGGDVEGLALIAP